MMGMIWREGSCSVVVDVVEMVVNGGVWRHVVYNSPCSLFAHHVLLRRMRRPRNFYNTYLMISLPCCRSKHSVFWFPFTFTWR